MPKELLRLCAVDDVKDKTALRVVAHGYGPLAVCRIGDAFYVVEDTCTHGLASLSEGEIEDGRIVCPFHGGAFELATGAPVVPPCTFPIATYAPVIENGQVFIPVAT